MGFIIQDYNLQEYMSMVFYCIVGMGVIFHWVHVWVGRPDSRLKAIERRMRWLEEGSYGWREAKPLGSLGYGQEMSGRRDSGCYAAPLPPHVSNPGSIFSNINDGPNSLFHAPPPSKRHRVDSYFNTPCCSESIAPHEIPITSSDQTTTTLNLNPPRRDTIPVCLSTHSLTRATITQSPSPPPKRHHHRPHIPRPPLSPTRYHPAQHWGAIAGAGPHAD